MQLAVSVPRAEPGETVTLSLEALHAPGGAPADLYAGAFLPGGREAVWVFATGLLSRPLPAGLPSLFPRLAELAPGAGLSAPALLRLTLSEGGVPSGTYLLVGALLRPGALRDNRVDAGDVLASSAATLEVSPTPATPPYTPGLPLLAQAAAVGPVLVTGGPGVAPAALRHAGTLLSVMLRHRPDVAARLRAAGALTAVFAHTETPCDLPYYPELRGQAICPVLVGGLGGTPGRPLTACPESNLLHLPGDPFARGVRADGENVCVHQLAHTILAAGLDEEERARVLARHTAALQEGRWAGHLALLSPEEFFAEMSQSYFCANPAVADARHPQGVNCAGALARHDPATHALLADIYGPPADLR